MPYIVAAVVTALIVLVGLVAFVVIFWAFDRFFK